MDFKIGDDIDENGAVEHKVLSDKTKIIIIVVVALLAGLSVFLITNALFGKKEVTPQKPTITKTTLTMSDEDVVESYKMLTYGAGGERDKKYISGIDIDSNSFGNSEKYYFALQYAAKVDFTESDRTDDKGFKIYTLPDSSMDIYMQRYFGPDVSYTKDGEISNTFRFRIDGKDTGIIKYNSNNAEFEMSLSELRTPAEKKLVDDVYYYLDEAYSYSDGRLVLKEKVLFTKVLENQNGTMDIYLYSDFERQNSIGTINGVAKENPEVTNNNVDETSITADKYANYPKLFNIEDYKDKCGTITYNLKIGERGYYFVNSEISK